MPQYLKDYGERLVELGYRIVPLPPGSKGPRRKGWPKFNPDAAQVRQWYSNGSAHDGVGVLAATTPAIDVDILDPEVAQQMSDEIDRIFAGQGLMTRTGRAPKFLIPFRSDEPFRKIISSVFTDGKNEHKVEVLGDGQQWVAYHVHPDTGRPYSWFDGLGDGGIADVEHAALPVLDRESAQRVVDAFEVLAAERVRSGVWARRVSASERTASDVSPSDPFAPHAEPVKDLSRAQVEALIHKLDWDSRDDWVRAGRVLHHQYEGDDEGFEIWSAWATNSSKWDAKTEAAVWASFGQRHDAPETIRALLKEFGQPKPAPLPSEGFVQAAAFAAGNRTEWLIKHVLPKRSLIVVYGAPGSSKSFFVLDMVAAVARGVEWRGHRVRQCSVAYIAAEGAGGFGNRLAAYGKGHDTPLANVPLYVRGGAFNLKDQMLDACEQVKSLSDIGIVVIDTLASVTPGANENTSEDMGSAIDSAQRIIETTGASVILIHHANKAGEIRGWSGLLAAADNTIRVEQSESLRTAYVEKQKEGAATGKYGYRLKVVDLYVDEDGDPVTSCIVEPCEELAPKTSGQKSRAGDFDTSANFAKARHYLHIIEELSGITDANMDEKDVIQAIQDDETVNPLKEPDYPRPDNIKRTLLKLAEKGKIRREGRWIKVCR